MYSVWQEVWCVHRSMTGSPNPVDGQTAAELFVRTWQRWGQFSAGYRSCIAPAPRSVLAFGPQDKVFCGSDRFFGLEGEWETLTRPAMVDTQCRPLHRRRKMMKTLLMTARWRSCFSSRTLQVSDRVNTDCSSSTLTSSGGAGSSTWPQVRRAFTPGLSRSSNWSLYKIPKPDLK